jgi:hypothetical protein
MMVFREAFITSLGTTFGCNHAPLGHSIYDVAIPVAAVYIDDQERVIAITPLTGNQYQRDLMRVWDILQSLVLEVPAWHYIISYDQTHNG